MFDSSFEQLDFTLNKRERNVNLPKEVVKLTSNVFQSNKHLVKMSLNEKLQILEKSSFKNCVNLRKVYFPLKINLIKIPESCFENCISLEYFSIPTSISDIKSKAFKNCNKIEVLTIPNTIIRIDNNAFYGWNYSQEIVLYKDYGEFTNCDAKITKHFEKTEENKEAIINKQSGIRYFAVTCKCGHVSRKHYMPITFPVVAKNRKEAANLARQIPRVKHNHKDAILQNDEISYTGYLDIKEKNLGDPYLNVKSSYEQDVIFDLIKDRLVPEVDLNIKSNKKTKNTIHYDGKKQIRNFKKYMNCILL